MNKKDRLVGKTYFEQTFFEPVDCPKCESACFDMGNRDGEWRNDENTKFYLTFPDGQTRRDLDFIIVQCLICQSKIKVEFFVLPMLAVEVITTNAASEERKKD